MVEIARSTLYWWIRDFSYLLNEQDKFVLHSSIMDGLQLNCKVANRRQALQDAIKKFIIVHVTKNPMFSMKKLMKKLMNTYNMTISRGTFIKFSVTINLLLKKCKNDISIWKTNFKKAVKTPKKLLISATTTLLQFVWWLFI